MFPPPTNSYYTVLAVRRYRVATASSGALQIAPLNSALQIAPLNTPLSHSRSRRLTSMTDDVLS